MDGYGQTSDPVPATSSTVTARVHAIRYLLAVRPVVYVMPISAVQLNTEMYRI